MAETLEPTQEHAGVLTSVTGWGVAQARVASVSDDWDGQGVGDDNSSLVGPSLGPAVAKELTPDAISAASS